MFEAQFQSFDDRADRAACAPRLAALRAELQSRGLDGFVVPRADRYLNEYVPPSDERLAWLTGFTGSSGIAVVLADSAALFVDGRYQVQVREEVDSALFSIEHLVEQPAHAWIKDNLPAGAQLGYSPWLHTVDGAERLTKACADARGNLVAVEENPIDVIWTDRPEPPLGPVVLHDLRYAGEDAASKIARLRGEMLDQSADTLMVSDPHALSWLFNIRGSDIPHNPVVLAFATCPRPAGRRCSSTAQALATTSATAGRTRRRAASAEVHAILPTLGARGRSVMLDPAAPMRSHGRRRAAGGTMVEGADPSILPKASKNAAELAGARAAQHATAWRCPLPRLARRRRRTVTTEIDAVQAAQNLARARPRARGTCRSRPSPAHGPNGAIVHYRVTEKTNRRIRPASLPDRLRRPSIATARPTSRARSPSASRTREMRERFTLVLKGHIAIATRAFPKARAASTSIRSRGGRCGSTALDFDHGTGHGVGSYLSVHEGPQRISKAGMVPLQPGMILLQRARLLQGRRLRHPHREPGAGDAQAEPVPAATADAGFETLTLAPIDRRLDRAGDADAPTRSPGSTPITRACAKRLRRWSIPRRERGCSRRPSRCRTISRFVRPVVLLTRGVFSAGWSEDASCLEQYSSSF